MKTKIKSIIEIIILVLVTVGLFTILGPCNGDKVMKCNYSVNVVKLLFATGIIVKVIEIFAKEQASIYFDIFSILLYIDCILVPALLIGGCQMDDMACRSVSFPSIYVVSVLLIIINVFYALSYLLKERKQ